MQEEALNISIRKFLKMVGVNSQREIEHAVSSAIDRGDIEGAETLPVSMTLEIAGLNLKVQFEGNIGLK